MDRVNYMPVESCHHLYLQQNTEYYILWCCRIFFESFCLWLYPRLLFSLYNIYWYEHV